MIRTADIAINTVLLSVITALGCSANPRQSQHDQDSRPRTRDEYAASLPDGVYPDSRSRIPLVERSSLGPEKRARYDALASPNTTSLTGLQGPGGLRLNATGYENPDESLVDKRTRELARLVVSREMDQAFEWTVHEPVALQRGLEPGIIDVIRHGRPLDGVPDREASIIQLGREVFRNHRVSPETFARVHGHLGTQQLIDLCDFMGNYTRTAIPLHTFDVHLPHDRKPLLPVE